jgi:acetylornithine/succinyldiaminopimelate/putrescine aminotransferase
MTRSSSSDFEGWGRAFARHLAWTSAGPIGIVVDRAEGPWIHSPDGRRYLDLLAGIAVANIGHTHPEVVAAVERQSRRHHHVMVYGEYVQQEQALYAAELAEALPGGIDRVFFVNSGAEAVEGALKLARKATGRLFACERWGVVPDVIVLAKALGGGYPLGAFAAAGPLMETLSHDPPLSHVTTFGGHPVSCAAGRAALRVLRRDRLVERSERVGASFASRLRETLQPYGGIREVRGLGLFVGIEFASAGLTHAFTDACRERGLLVGWTLHHDNIVRLAPPLNTPEEVLAEAARTMGEALASVS